jgi:hypothetical protein
MVQEFLVNVSQLKSDSNLGLLLVLLGGRLLGQQVDTPVDGAASAVAEDEMVCGLSATSASGGPASCDRHQTLIRAVARVDFENIVHVFLLFPDNHGWPGY